MSPTPSRRRPLLAPVLASLVVLVLMGFGTNDAHAEIVSYSEDFSSWRFRDAELSTAWWDTLAGEIKLYPTAIDEQSVLPTGSIAYDVVVNGDFAFLANGAAGLLVVNVSDPQSPVVVDNLVTSDDARGIATAGSLAYLAIGTDGLEIAAIGDPGDLFHVGSTDLNGFAYAVAVAGSFAYLATANIGLSVVRIIDAGDPNLVAEEASSDWAQDLDLWQQHAYIADGNGGLSVMDISTPSEPELVGNLDTEGYSYGVAVDYPFAYLADGAGGLVIANVSVPSSPTLVSTLDLPGTARGISSDGDYVYVAAGVAGLHVVEVSDPVEPILRGSYNSVGDARAVTVGGQLAYLADGAGGLAIVAVDPGGFNTSANRAQSLTIAESSDPIVRARLSCVATDTVDWHLSVDGGTSWNEVLADNSWFAFAEAGTTLQWRASLAYDGGPVGPSCTQLNLDYDILHSSADIFAVDDIPEDLGSQVRVSWSASRFDVIDSETLITEYSLYRRIPGSAGQNLPLYPPGEWDYLLTVPADTEQQYAVVAPTLGDSTVVDGMFWSVFFVRARTDQIGVYFDSTPDSGYSLNNLRPDPPSGFEVTYDAVEGNQLSWDPYPGENLAHFRVYRSANPDFEPLPANLLQIVHDNHYLDSAGLGEFWYYRLTAVALDGNESYPVAPQNVTVAAPDDEGGPPIRTRLLVAHPNPFNPLTEIRFVVAAGAAAASLSIYDLRGHLVRRLGSDYQPAAAHAVVWDGRDNRGRDLPSGVYHCRLVSGKTADVRKLTLAR